MKNTIDDTCKYLHCPLGVEVGFISCHWWTNTHCSYPTLRDKKQLEDLKAMREAGKDYGKK